MWHKADLSKAVSQVGVNPVEVVIDQRLFSQALAKMNRHVLEQFISYIFFCQLRWIPAFGSVEVKVVSIVTL